MAELLRQHDITFARVDGSMSFSQRQQAFQSFKTSSDVNILLMTIGTGAVGYLVLFLSCPYVQDS